MWKLFSKKKSKRSSTAPVEQTHTTITKIRDNLAIQEKREIHLTNKIKILENQAKSKMSQGDKRGAIFCMKKKKLHEQEIIKIEQIKMTLETQVMNLEGAVHNVQTFTAMKSGTNHMKKIRKSLGIDAVDDLMDDMRDEMDMQHEVDAAFARPLDPLLGADEDELLAELNALTEAEVHNTKVSSSFWPTTPTSNPMNNNSTSTSVPSQQPSKRKFALFA